MAREGMDESLALLSTLTVAIAGLNIVWGIFLYPWGVIGFAFAAVDIFLFFMVIKIRELYESRDYVSARNKLKVFVIIGFVSGLVFLGAVAYPRYRELDDIVSKRYLIKASSEEFYAPPQFPGRKN